VTALRRLPLVVALATIALGAVTPAARAAGGEAARLREAREHYEQAVAHYNLDEFAPALAEFREAYRLKPDPSFLFNIAQCHRKLGDADAALDFYRKYLRSLPDAPNRADVERMIADLRAKQAAAPAAGAPATTESPAPAAHVEATPVPAPTTSAVPAAPSAALVASPAAESPAPVYKRWWFWTALGAVVAGAVIAGFVLSRPAPQPYQGTLDPHTIEVR
jgi:tetratricopeptide (TPR) repeat protein